MIFVTELRIARNGKLYCLCASRLLTFTSRGYKSHKKINPGLHFHWLLAAITPLISVYKIKYCHILQITLLKNHHFWRHNWSSHLTPGPGAQPAPSCSRRRSRPAAAPRKQNGVRCSAGAHREMAGRDEQAGRVEMRMRPREGRNATILVWWTQK